MFKINSSSGGVRLILTDKKILITRPKEQGLDFAQKTKLDMDSFFFEPLIKIKYLDVTLPDLDLYDGVITTSNHAKKILPDNYPCYDIGNYAPRAKDLADKIIRENRDKNLHLLYIRGVDISFDMKKALNQYHVDELINYKAIAVNGFSNELIRAFKDGDIKVITFFSKRTAEIFVKLAIQHGILHYLNDIKALCINNGMVECLYPVFGNNIEISNSPNARAMAQLISDIQGVR